MNKNVITTLAVIVGLLFIWLIIVLILSPVDSGEELPETTDPAVEMVDDSAEGVGAPSGSVTATVEIVGSDEEVDEENSTDATVEIE